MRDYILGDKVISTTPEKYESIFKAMGYEPLKKEQPKKEEPKKEILKEDKKVEEKEKKTKKEL